MDSTVSKRRLGVSVSSTSKKVELCKEVSASLDSDSLVSECCISEEPKTRCATGRTMGPSRRSMKGKWTEDQDKLLVEMVKKFNEKNWKSIAENIPGKTDVQCLHRWQKVLNPNLVKGTWTKEEDDKIIEQVGKYGCKCWSLVAKSLPGRIGKQCRERWHNHLNPKLNKGTWTAKEEQDLIQAHKMYGNKWATLAKFLPGRSENAIKNHWNCSLKKKLDLTDQQSAPSNSNAMKKRALNMLVVHVGKETSEMPNTMPSKKLLFDKESSGRQSLILKSSPICGSKSSKLEFQPSLQEGFRCLEVDRNDITTSGNGQTVKHAQTSFEDENLDFSSDSFSDYTGSPCLIYDYEHAQASWSTHKTIFLSSDSFVNQNLLPPFHSDKTPYALKRKGFTITDKMLTPKSNGTACDDVSGDEILHGHDRTPQTPSFIGNTSGDNSLKPEIYMQVSDSFQSSSSPGRSLDVSLNVQDFQLCIRRAAKRFRNTPSIIRKKHLECLSQQTSACNDGCDGVCAGSVDTILRLAPRQSQTLGSQIEKVKCHNLELFSVDYILRSNGMASKEFRGKCLEHEFDTEWAAANSGHAASVGHNCLISNLVSREQLPDTHDKQAK